MKFRRIAQQIIDINTIAESLERKYKVLYKAVLVSGQDKKIISPQTERERESQIRYDSGKICKYKFFLIKEQPDFGRENIYNELARVKIVY